MKWHGECCVQLVHQIEEDETKRAAILARREEERNKRKGASSSLAVVKLQETKSRKDRETEAKVSKAAFTITDRNKRLTYSFVNVKILHGGCWMTDCR